MQCRLHPLLPVNVQKGNLARVNASPDLAVALHIMKYSPSW